MVPEGRAELSLGICFRLWLAVLQMHPCLMIIGRGKGKAYGLCARWVSNQRWINWGVAIRWFRGSVTLSTGSDARCLQSSFALVWHLQEHLRLTRIQGTCWPRSAWAACPDFNHRSSQELVEIGRERWDTIQFNYCIKYASLSSLPTCMLDVYRHRRRTWMDH